jgi:hypothetical protein
MARQAPPECATCADCRRCRAGRLSIDISGGLSSQALMRLAGPPPERVVDADVAAAEAARDEARTTFDQFDTMWRTAVQQRRAVEYDETVPAHRRQDLADAEETARERRDRAWAGVVRGNGAVDAAARAPMLRTH